MRLLVTGSTIRGLPVVTIDGGEDVAEVRDLIYSADAGRVLGLTLNKRGFLSGRRREVLSADKIHAIGRDAVMINNESRLVMPEDAPEDVGAPQTERDVIGNEVITDAGTTLGRVRDVVVLVGSTGDVVGYEIDKAAGGTAYLPLPAQLAISGTTLVVPAKTEEFVVDDLVGLGAAVDEFRAKLPAS